MATPTKHAVLSASASHRWLSCTASPKFEMQFPDATTQYSREGTTAHELCELNVRYKFLGLSASEFENKFNEIKNDPSYNIDMIGSAEAYLEFIEEQVMGFKNPPYVTVETKVDLTDYIPDGFGTCDCIIIGDDVLQIVDYKNGVGVVVSSEDNPQMKLYALGALKMYEPFYDIKKVKMSIVQPRVTSEFSTFEMSVEDLVKWGTEEVAPKAKKAFEGKGTYAPGEHCRFCKGREVCRARSLYYAKLSKVAGRDPNTLTHEEIGELLEQGRGLDAWLKDLSEYAMRCIGNGEEINGWKIVEGRSVRQFSNQEEAFNTLISHGVPETMLYERKAKSLTEIEKMMGKKEFTATVGEFVTKPSGKPTLVPSSDKRPSFNSAVNDFQGL